MALGLRSFVPDDEAALARQFQENGHVIAPVEDRTALDGIAQLIALRAATKLGLPSPKDPIAFLDGIDAHVTPAGLNDLRLDVMAGLRAEPGLRPAYFSLARRAIENIVGNELAMQRGVNLSIQLPQDASSLLPVHADVLNGDSAFEVVLWIPLVDCRATKSMFLLPPGASAAAVEKLDAFAGRASEDIYGAIESDLLWMDVPYGHFLLFSQNLLHGNRVNRERGTRWSLNCRFKSLLSPYADKRFGEFFEPIVIRPATRLGMSFREPAPFAERADAD
jgi:sporadic carbohydrate cluster 2OG-Fe(II) oxygenase